MAVHSPALTVVVLRIYTNIDKQQFVCLLSRHPKFPGCLYVRAPGSESVLHILLWKFSIQVTQLIAINLNLVLYEGNIVCVCILHNGYELPSLCIPITWVSLHCCCCSACKLCQCVPTHLQRELCVNLQQAMQVWVFAWHINVGRQCHGQAYC